MAYQRQRVNHPEDQQGGSHGPDQPADPSIDTGLEEELERQGKQKAAAEQCEVLKVRHG